MTDRRQSRVLAPLLCGLAMGCTEPRIVTPADPVLSPQRQLLSEGYSLLHTDASRMGYVDWVLYVKVESKAVDDLLTAVGEFGGELKNELESIARDYPGVRLDLDPLPEMEKRKRRSIVQQRALDFAPGIGRGGREYERTILISLSNAFNHERNLCQVMAEEEPDPGLKRFLERTQKRFSELHDRALALLEKKYFSNPNGPSAK